MVKKMSSVCKLCKDSFSCEELLSFHMKSHFSKSFSCSNCRRSFRFSGYNTLRTDYPNFHRVEYTESNELTCLKPILKCSYCKRIFNHRFQWRRHFYRCQKSYSCGHCLKVFSTKNTLELHLNSHVLEESNLCKICNSKELCCHINADILKYPYLCVLCNSAFKSKTKLYDHLLFHKNLNCVSCSICKKIFRNKKYFNLHSAWNHVDGVYRCSKCPKKFCFRSFLNNHLKRHMQSSMPLKHRKTSMLFQPRKCLFCKRLASFKTLKRYQCEDCSESFRFQSNFETHIKLHLSNELFICKICNQTFSSAENFRVHLQFHSDTSSHKVFPIKTSEKECCYCNEHFSNKEGLYKHLSLHPNTAKLICKICKNDFVDESSLLSHLEYHEKSKPPVNEMEHNYMKCGHDINIHCHICLKEFTLETALIAHLQIHSIEQQSHILCKFCPETFPSSDVLNAHLCKHKEEKQYSCTKCHNTFNQKCSLEKHLAQHGEYQKSNSETSINSSASVCDAKERKYPQKDFVCKICQQKFSSENLLLKHAEEHHSCTICDKTFNKKELLENHLEMHLRLPKTSSTQVPIHSKQKLYPCYYCRKTFVCKATLITHLHTHSHICKICNKKFNNRAHWLKHLNVHKGQKPFVCHICQKAFNQKRNLNKHIKSLHKRDDESKAICIKSNISTMATELCNQDHYACKKCTEKFSELTPFVDHLLKHTEKLYVCEECEKEFDDKRKLITHLKMHKINDQMNTFGKENVKIHECNYCLKVFLFRSSLLEHLEEHTGTKLHECSTCSEAFTEVMDFVNHIEIHGSICRDSDSSVLNLEELYKNKPGNRRESILYEVNDDGNTKNSESVKLIEDKDAAIQKYYECRICSKTFKKFSVYQQHLLKHNKRRFECDLCKKRFTRAASLRRHSVIHNSLALVNFKDVTSVQTTAEHDYAHQDTCTTERTDDENDDPVLESTNVPEAESKNLAKKIPGKKTQGKGRITHQRKGKSSNAQQKSETETCLKMPVEVAAFYDNTSQSDNDVYICSFCQGLYKGGTDFLEHLNTHGDVDVNVKHVKLQPVPGVAENSEQPTDTPAIITQDQNETVDISTTTNTLETLLLECGAIRSAEEVEMPKNAKIPETVTAIEGLEIQNTLTADELILIDAAKEYIENHPAENVQICGCCLDIYQTRNDLHEHLKTHSVEDRTFCKICIRRYREDKEPCAHLRIYTDEMKYLCEYCAKPFATKSDLICHLPTHTKEKPFSCHICDMRFRHRGFLNAHIRIHTGEKPFLCQFCTKAFRVKSTLNKHIRMHTGEKPHVCGFCLKAYARKISLTTHLQCHANDILPACRVCNKDLLNGKDLCRHVSSTVHEKPHGCEHCGKLFFTKNELVLHLRTHLGPRPFKCHLCDRSFNAPGSVTLHIKSFHNEEHHGYQCLICNKSFSHKSKLIKHFQKQHKDQNLFLCKFCDEHFDSQEKLDEHAAIHPRHRTATFPCPYCKKSFLRKTTFDNHLAKHNERMQQKPLFCKICSKTLSTRNSYLEHLRMHISKKSMVCNICNEVFRGRISLRRHMQKHCMEASTAEASAIATLQTVEGGNFAFPEGVAVQVIQLEVEPAQMDPQYVAAEIVVT